jgi:hypothetical protein
MHTHGRLLTTFAFACALSLSASAEEPLPAIRLRQTPVPVDLRSETLPNFDLPVEPLSRTLTTVAPLASTDGDGSSENYALAASPGQSTATSADLQALSAYQQENAAGSWYGAEMHDRLAAAYPGYGKYIADFAIVDGHGETYYPTTETRRFLLQEARNSNSSRRALTSIAENRLAAPRVSRADASDDAVAPLPRISRRRLLKASADTQTLRSASPAPIVSPLPVVTIAERAIPAPAPAVTHAAMKPRPVDARPKVVTANVIASNLPPRAAALDDQPATRGLILLVLGVLGVGMLTMFARVPAPVRNDVPPATSPSQHANVEPIKGRKALKEQRGARRATGSRG